jgi:hypothetical protein
MYTIVKAPDAEKSGPQATRINMLHIPAPSPHISPSCRTTPFPYHPPHRVTHFAYPINLKIETRISRSHTTRSSSLRQIFSAAVMNYGPRPRKHTATPPQILTHFLFPNLESHPWRGLSSVILGSVTQCRVCPANEKEFRRTYMCAISLSSFSAALKA